MKSKQDYSEYYAYLDTLTESERRSNAKFRLRQKFNISRGKAQKVLGSYYKDKAQSGKV